MTDDFILDAEIREYAFSVDKLCDEELERALLENGGPLDKLVVAELPDATRYLVDGYRRHRICEEHHLRYSIDVRKFETRAEIFDFMDQLQLARRNLSGNQLSLIRARRKKRHEGDMGALAAAAETAEEHGVSTRTVFRDEEYADAVEQIDPTLRDAVVADMSKAAAIELAKVPKKDQKKALKKGGGKRAPKPPPTFKDAKDEAGKLCAKLQNSLSDVHKAKADAIRLKSAKGRAKEIGGLLDAWGSGYVTQ